MSPCPPDFFQFRRCFSWMSFLFDDFNGGIYLVLFSCFPEDCFVREQRPNIECSWAATTMPNNISRNT